MWTYPWPLWPLAKSHKYMWHAGCDFLIFCLSTPNDALSQVVSARDYDAMSDRYIVSSRHDITLWHHSWHHTAHAPGLYKDLAPHHGGDSWSDSRWVRRYALMCLHWESLLPSNITDWVVITRPYVPVSADTSLHFENSPGALCSS